MTEPTAPLELTFEDSQHLIDALLVQAARVEQSSHPADLEREALLLALIEKIERAILPIVPDWYKGQ